MQNLLKKCIICPRNCGVDRTHTFGYCGTNNKIKVAKAFLHQWEEPCISGSRGSGTVFFSGCNMKCVFCQNYDISQGTNQIISSIVGKEISVEQLSDTFLKLQSNGAHNINLVSPTPYALHIIEAIKISKQNGLMIPVIYNTNGFEKIETIEMLKETVDIFLPDIKYIDSKLAAKYSDTQNYFEYTSKAIGKMIEQAGYAEFDQNEILIKGVIIRHLILPNQLEESKKILKWIKENFGSYVHVSLMCQYIPIFKSNEYKELSRRVTQAEYDEVIDYFIEIGLKNGFMQELEAASESFIPSFDLQGV